jgi:hypothetical protein
MFVPTILSIWYQPMLVTLLLGYIAMYNVIALTFPDSSLAGIHKIWSTIGVMLSLILLALVGLQYSIWHWRVILPFLFGFTATLCYSLIQVPYVPDNDYWEVVWYLLSSAMFTLLVLTPVHIGDAVNEKYSDIFRRVWYSFQHPPAPVQEMLDKPVHTADQGSPAATP